MIFQILLQSSDTCGNEDTLHHAFVEAPSQAEAERIYPRTGMFLSFKVVPLRADPLPAHPRNHTDCVAAYGKARRGY